MHRNIDAGLDALTEAFFGSRTIDPEIRRRSMFAALCMVISAPLVLKYSWYDFVDARYAEAAFLGLGLLLWLVIVFRLRHESQPKPLWRLGVFIALAMMISRVYWGAEHNLGLFWFYFYPVAVLFLLGKREGLNWSLVSLGLVAIPLLTGITVASYDAAMVQLFLVTYVVTIMLSYGLEHSRYGLEQRLYYLASIDPLTQLLNRRQLLLRMDEELARARRYKYQLALLLIDLDHFKSINDRHGHAIGDEVLRCFAQCLDETFRGNDLIGRLGGEEFVVLLPMSDVDSSLAAADRLRAALAVAQKQRSLPDAWCTVSVGVSLSQPSDSISDLLGRADRAMYHAKQAGRDAVAWSRHDGELQLAVQHAAG